jgi:hypothetical protein
VYAKLENDSNFSLLTSGIQVRSYTASTDLIAGENYVFKVKARNAVGLSLDSEVVTIRAARIPDVPANLQTSIDQADQVPQNVIISWEMPYDGGSPLLSFTVELKQ